MNKPYGYNSEYCVICDNGDAQNVRQKVKYDNFRINLPNKCIGSLDVISAAKSSFTINYDLTKKIEKKEENQNKWSMV